MPGITAIPVLRVADFKVAVPFYRDVLGFTVGFQYDDYVSLQLDKAVLHLSVPKPGKPAGGGTVNRPSCLPWANNEIAIGLSIAS